MPLPQTLRDGYQRFRQNAYKPKTGHFEHLAQIGQTPSAMLIGCSDSRADPNMIFDAEPGELFIVRNVANLVPSFEHEEKFYCAGAAIEYAVVYLKIPNIIILGHSGCGGIKTFCQKKKGQPINSEFINTWLSILDNIEAVSNQRLTDIDLSNPNTMQNIEMAAIKNSINNIRSFPFVKEAEKKGQLTIYGAYFNISHGILMLLDEDINEFKNFEEF